MDFSQLLDDDIFIFLVGGVIAVTAILTGLITSVVKTRSRERTRREIAAYIAEGPISPEQGERLINARFRDD